MAPNCGEFRERRKSALESSIRLYIRLYIGLCIRPYISRYTRPCIRTSDSNMGPTVDSALLSTLECTSGSRSDYTLGSILGATIGRIVVVGRMHACTEAESQFELDSCDVFRTGGDYIARAAATVVARLGS